LKFRHAKQSDKNNLLRFCTNTFEWGDYIEEVWDEWYSDPNGYLIIAEENEVIAAVSHVYQTGIEYGWKVLELILISDAELLQRN
jgi:hypothetical protein